MFIRTLVAYMLASLGNLDARNSLAANRARRSASQFSKDIARRAEEHALRREVIRFLSAVDVAQRYDDSVRQMHRIRRSSRRRQ